ncbi:MAG: hypothetical protein AMJ90_00975 [candidate division Zixibacteria bacterium SM23_73_2]|nr:MAG: hypothetical protein AMJ90_00975 [candidate division Zixibacteria bacterium SM23_73_2]
MSFSESLRSKKIKFGLGAIGALFLGFFMLKFMTSGGGEVTEKISQRTSNPRKTISQPKKEEPTKSPLFQALKDLQDPFRGESPEMMELQNKIKKTQKEIEFLKVSLEAKKLKEELKKLGGETILKEIEKKEGKSTSGISKMPKTKSSDNVLVKAIMITDEKKNALLISGGKRSWVCEGEEFDGWRVKQIKNDSVVLSKAGKTYVFFYDRSSFFKEGKS